MIETKQVLNNWTFKSCDDDEWLPAKVPGCVHTDLLRNQQIPEPFYGTNEGDLQWIDKKDWEYQTVFDVSIQEDLPKLEKLGYSLPAVNDQSDRGGLGDKKVSVFARKAPYHYGWDWGPRFVTSGIWREVRLEGWTGCRIADVFIHQRDVSDSVAKLTAFLEIESDSESQGVLKLSCEGQEWTQAVCLEPGRNQIELTFEIENPKLWWTRGLGDQNMYEFQATLVQDGVSVAEKSVKTGLRSIRLVREQDDKGTSFYFELNGVPVFAKGANHIPNDSFLTEVTFERYKHEIVTAVESNMNMLRVWGGGIYEDDAFYSLCDEYGILVWQDFMFACSMYPGDEAFLENVRREAEQNIKRLRNHPCIALWCGNNEIDTAWSHYDEHAGWGWKQQYAPQIREKIWADYEAIFHRILPEAVSKFAPGADYWPSSPMKALTKDKDQHAKNDSTSGDIHYWGVWHNVKPFSNYNVYVGRFMSEYGFQSFPEWKTVKTYASEKGMELTSEVMRWHQRSGDGNRLITAYMDIYCKEPKDFPSFLYMSQILQAEAIQSAIEAHRRKKPYCMGSLYWQINDCWPVASWSSMDYFGRWKAVQYFVKRSYRDIVVSIDGSCETSMDIHVISDVLHSFSGTVLAKLYDFRGTLLREASQPIDLTANSAQVVLNLSVADVLAGYKANEVVLLVTIERNGEVIDSKVHYFVPTKELELKAPSITIREVEYSRGTAFVLDTNILAKNVCVSAEIEGIFSDNFFDLIPGIPKTVRFLARGTGEAPFVPASPDQITVRSMIDFIQL